MDRLQRLRDVVAEFPKARVAVIGDLVADQYVYGQTKRVSREAPVLILEYRSERLVLGGAANAIHNARALGAHVRPIGVVGKDATGRALTTELEGLGLRTDTIIEDADRLTTTKQRIVGNGQNTTFQQMLRIDRGDTSPVSRTAQAALLGALEIAANECDVLIVSDYGYGVMTPSVIQRVNGLATEKRIRVLIDSRYRLREFENAFAMTPNEPEAQEASGLSIRSDRDAERVGRKLAELTGAESVLVTRGRRGMTLVRGEEPAFHVPVFGGDEIADVTGAGDTVIATLATSLSSGADLAEACVLANVAGGLVVMKAGTATVSAAEIADAIEREDPWPAS